MDAKEFKQVLKDLGHSDITPQQVDDVLKKVDKNNDSVIDWLEFLDMFQSIKKGDTSNFGEALEHSKGAAAQVTGAVGSTHTYLIEERSVFSRMINKELKDDELLKDRLPMNVDSEDLFHIMSDGLVLIRLLNRIEKDLIDMRTVNKGSNLNIYKIRENLNLGLTACSGLIKLVGIDATAFLEKKPYLVLAVLAQLIRLIASENISLKDCPEIMRLAETNEELSDLLKLSPEKILIRWVNFHLKAAGQELRINNLGKDLVDSKALLYVCHQLNSSVCSLDALNETDNLKRAEQLILNSQALGVADVASAEDIIKGNSKVNTIFVAELFNTKHGLEELTKVEQEAYEAAAMEYDDIEGSNEERSFRMWINSLGIEDLFVDNLYEEARDGVLLLKVIHRINPNVVEWNRVEKNANNHFKKGINCQVAFDACGKLKISLVGIGASDIQDGNKKLILAIVWQLVRLHYMQIIGSKTDKDLLVWCNQRVSDLQIDSFRDKKLADGRYLIKLCASLEPRIVNWDLVTAGETDEDKELNAKYAISIARKLGATIFLVWDDIPKVNPKMILIFVASLYDLANQIQ